MFPFDRYNPQEGYDAVSDNARFHYTRIDVERIKKTCARSITDSASMTVVNLFRFRFRDLCKSTGLNLIRFVGPASTRKMRCFEPCASSLFM